jgi:3-hexulose-6-phosphate synthase
MRPIVQISLDIIDLDEALETAEMALRAGVDWLEAGTPLLLAEGTRGVRAIHERFPGVPIVADLKIMDGGWLEVEMMAKAGASIAVVMGQACPETLEECVRAGRDFGVKIMGDDLGMPDPIQAAKSMEAAGCDYIIHHVAYDLRTVRKRRGEPVPSPLDCLREIVKAVRIPVQAVGGLSVEQAIETPLHGAPLVVLGAPLVIDAHAFQTAAGNVEQLLRLICERVHGEDHRQ